MAPQNEMKSPDDVARILTGQQEIIPNTDADKKRQAKELAAAAVKEESGELSRQKKGARTTAIARRIVSTWKKLEAQAIEAAKLETDSPILRTTHSYNYKEGSGREKRATVEIPNIISLQIQSADADAKQSAPKGKQKRNRSALIGKEVAKQDFCRFLFIQQDRPLPGKRKHKAESLTPQKLCDILLKAFDVSFRVDIYSEDNEKGNKVDHVGKIDIYAKNDDAANIAKKTLQKVIEEGRKYRTTDLAKEMTVSRVQSIIRPIQEKYEATQRKLEHSQNLLEHGGSVVHHAQQEKPRITLAQSSNDVGKAAIAAFKEKDALALIGPAATGKTHMAMALAAELVLNGDYKSIVITRALVEAGEKLGFLPGDIDAKIEPYLGPIRDVSDNLGHAQVLTDAMKFVPLAVMRGRTLSSTIVIVDEAQNMTVEQAKMLITRVGLNSKLILTGDPDQNDLPPNKTSGLPRMLKILEMMPSGHIAQFTMEHAVYRSPMVQEFLQAEVEYDRLHPEEKNSVEINDVRGTRRNTQKTNFSVQFHQAVTDAVRKEVADIRLATLAGTPPEQTPEEIDGEKIDYSTHQFDDDKTPRKDGDWSTSGPITTQKNTP